MMLRRFIFLSLLLTCSSGWTQTFSPDLPTTGTLRLVDVVDLRPGKQGSFLTGPGRYDPNGPVLVIPDTSAWRIPRPDPTPQMVQGNEDEEIYDLPRLPLLISKERPQRHDVNRDAFQFRGLSASEDGKYQARLTLNTPYRQICTEYRLFRRPAKDEPDQLVLVLFHGPGTSENFYLQPGEYRLERRIWRPDSPDKFLEEHYRYQRLKSSGNYEWTLDQREEQDLLGKLRDKE